MNTSGSGVSLVRRDLLAEQDGLDRALRDQGEWAWVRPTASPRWSVADQVAHLTYFDSRAALAISDPDAFASHRAHLIGTLTDPIAVEEETLGSYRTMAHTELLAAWRESRVALAEASATLADDDRVGWYGPSMGAKSFLTARLMECWAHGIDVCDAIGVEVTHSDRVQHIARLGFITRAWSYVNRREEVPETEVRVELVAPSGATWLFGPPDASETVSGSAVDFCLVVTQRRHVLDTDLDVRGSAAAEWMEIAQAFAGPPTSPPDPGGGAR